MYQKLLCIFAFSASCAIAQIISGGNGIKFKLSAINLPNRDADGSDPYVKLFASSGPSRHPVFMRIGETGVAQNNNNPSWNEVFAYGYSKGNSQRWRFIVKDYDPGAFWDEHLGSVEIDVEAYMNEIRKDNGTRQAEPVQLALTTPPGGILVLTPVYDR